MLDTQEMLALERTVRAEPGEVFRTFTVAAALRDWLCHGARVEPRQGGHIDLSWNDGYYAAGTFTRFEPGAALEFTWQGPGDPAASQVKVSLSPQGDGTLVALVHEGIESPETAQKVRTIWENGLENLQSVVETGWDLRFIRRPMIGINGYDMLTPERAPKLGVPVTQGMWLTGLVEGLGAQQAGLQPNDVLVSVAGRPIVAWESLGYILSEYRAGDQVEIGFYRGPELRHVTMTLSPRPLPEIPQTKEALAEITRTNYEMVNGEIDRLLAGVTDAVAEYRPGPGEWNIKMILAHLIAGERDMLNYITEAIDDTVAEEIFHGNDSPRLSAFAEVYSPIERLVDELKRSEAMNVKMVETLPAEAVARKHLYNQIAMWMVGFVDHHREHFAEIGRLVEGARSQV